MKCTNKPRENMVHLMHPPGQVVMLKPGQIQWILRLAREGLSQRAIHRATGMARGTIRSVLDTNRPELTLRDTLYDVDDPVFTEPPRRCRGCGAIVYMPCLACRLRDS